MMTTDLTVLFNPNSIAVVGASQDPSKLATVILNNIRAAGFVGGIYPVNPKYPQIGDLKCYNSLSEIQSGIDMVVIVIPAQFVIDAIKDSANKGVRVAVIISAGFGELGEEGQRLQDEVLQIASQSGMRILGPNCLGISVPSSHLDASFAAEMPKSGDIAFLSQSGAFNTAMLDMAAKEQLGFSHFVSLGNKSDINEIDLIAAWIDDPQVKVIGMYLEEFSDGKDLVDLVAKTKKPVVVLHPGESAQAQQAIASHTGSLAGTMEVVHAGLTKAGAIQVPSAEKLFNVLKALSRTNKPVGDKTLVLTNAGGPGIMVTDMVVANGISLPELSDQLQSELRAVLPDAASTHNPVDLIGDALAERYKQSLEIVDRYNEVTSVVVLLTPQHVTQIVETANVLSEYSKTGSKALFVIFLGDSRVDAGLEVLHQSGVPAFKYAEEAIFALGRLSKFTKYQNEYLGGQLEALPASDKLAQVANQDLRALSQQEVHDIVTDLGFDLPKEATLSTFDQAMEFANLVRYPLVLKASTIDIAHKTDQKAIRLNILSQDELRRAFYELAGLVTTATGNENPTLLIQEQISGGEELIIGITRDGGSDVYQPNGKGFGHLLLVGKGGIYTEVYNDIAFGLVPMNREQLLDMVMSTNVSKILVGTRNLEGLAIHKLVDTLDSVQRLVMKYPEIAQLDINPAILTRDRCISVDLKVFVKK